jgi:hypothetical protein
MTRPSKRKSSKDEIVMERLQKKMIVVVMKLIYQMMKLKKSVILLYCLEAQEFWEDYISSYTGRFGR